jgi:hypothetical protein
LDPATTVVSFKTLYGDGTVRNTITCNLGSSGAGGCLAVTSVWPPNDTSNQVGSFIEIQLKTPFNSAISMFFPGSQPISFASGTLGANAGDTIQF